jgi:hypothetical protein
MDKKRRKSKIGYKTINIVEKPTSTMRGKVLSAALVENIRKP